MVSLTDPQGDACFTFRYEWVDGAQRDLKNCEPVLFSLLLFVLLDVCGSGGGLFFEAEWVDEQQ